MPETGRKRLIPVEYTEQTRHAARQGNTQSGKHKPAWRCYPRAAAKAETLATGIIPEPELSNPESDPQQFVYVQTGVPFFSQIRHFWLLGNSAVIDSTDKSPDCYFWMDCEKDQTRNFERGYS